MTFMQSVSSTFKVFGSLNNASSIKHSDMETKTDKNMPKRCHITKIVLKDNKHQIKVDMANKFQIVEEYCYLHESTETCKTYNRLLDMVCQDIDTNKEYQQILQSHDFYNIEHNRMLKVFSKLHILLDYYNQFEDNSNKKEVYNQFNHYYNEFYKSLLDLFEE